MDDCMVIWITAVAMKGSTIKYSFSMVPISYSGWKEHLTCSRKYDRSNMANMWKLGVAPLSRLSKLSHLM
ncbi:unnamed protein product, partial [Vitis vinifera]|uniref:Uncharacterized protein n=1 Tax=Vitis vinifera TaxID=29760 RepID=D7U626_VITVI